MANTHPEERTRVWVWILPALLVSGIVSSRVLLLVCLEWPAGAKTLDFVLHQVVHLILLLALLSLPYVLYRIYRAGGWGRAAVCFLLACLAVVLFMAQPSPTETFQIILYFPLGAALYRTRSRGGKNTGLRCYLDILLVVVITSFVEEIVKGFSPVSRYNFGPSNVNAMGMVGAFLARNLDFHRPYAFKAHSSSSTRKYAGKAPLLDIHLFWRDAVFLGLVGVLFMFHALIGSFYRSNNLVGEWSLCGSGNTALQISGDGVVFCHTGETGWVPVRSWGIEGNLLDGFFLSMWPQRRTENVHCSFLNPWTEDRRRFRLQGDTVVFDSITSNWLWPLKTLLGWKPGDPSTMRWERVG